MSAEMPEGMPEPPELPPELQEKLDAMAAGWDQHAEVLAAWANMAARFYMALAEAGFGPPMAQTLLMHWQGIFFEKLYQANIDAAKETNDGDSS